MGGALAKGDTATMVTEAFAVFSLRPVTIHFPRLAEFASGAAVPSAPTFVVHFNLLCF